MVLGRLAVVLTVAYLAGSLFGAEGETPSPMPPPASVDPRGTPPEAPANVGPVAPTTPAPPPAAMPSVPDTSPEITRQDNGDRRPRLRGRLRARLRALFQGGN
jgi:hypothetical protein